MIFGNTHQGGGYDIVLLGQMGDVKIDVDLIEQRLGSPSSRRCRSRCRIGFCSGVTGRRYSRRRDCSCSRGCGTRW